MELKGSYNLKTLDGVEPQSICITANLLVLRCYIASRQSVLKAFDIWTGKFMGARPIPCAHYPPVGSLVPYGRHGEFVLEACPGCAQIRIHNVMTQEVSVVCQGIALRNLCSGPQETLLGLTSEGDKLVQLSPVAMTSARGSGAKAFTIRRVLNIKTDDVNGMEYFHNCSTIVLARSAKIQGIKLATEEILWQWNRGLGSVTLSPRDVSRSFPGDWVCVANGDNVLVLKASDGSFCEEILRGEGIDSAIWFSNNFVTKQANDRITVYEVSNLHSDYEYPACPLPLEDS